MESIPSEPVVPGAEATTVIRLEGRDVLDVLHRISTQALSDLAPGEARTTLFCDFRGRLLHRAAVAVTADGAVWLARDDAPADALAAHIDRHVFREDVRLFPSTRLAVRAVEGGFDLPPGTLVEEDGVPLKLQLAERFGYRLDDPLETPPEPAGEVARIVAGRPRHGHEIDESFNPFEVGLAHEVHLHKGCFTGQEALMRMVTYRGVRRRLARLGGGGTIPATPRDVRDGEGVVGRLTSAAANTRGWVGLAVMRSAAIESGAALTIEGSGAIEVPIAFPETRPLGLP